MKKLLVTVALATLSSLCCAQYVVYDPANLTQNQTSAAQQVMAVIRQYQQYQTQIEQYYNEAKQLQSMNPSSLSSLTSGTGQNLANVNGYINALKTVYGDLNSAQTRISTDFSAAQLQNMTWAQYQQKQQQDIQKGVQAAQLRAQSEAATLQSVQNDYAVAQQWQSQIPSTAGTHEAVQLMNAQMNRVVMQNAEIIKQLQAMNGSAQAADANNKLIDQARANDAATALHNTISADNAAGANFVNGLR